MRSVISAAAAIENGMPISDRVPVHLLAAPAARAGDGRNKIGADASLDLHVRLSFAVLAAARALKLASSRSSKLARAVQASALP